MAKRLVGSGNGRGRMVRLGRSRAYGCTVHTMIETRQGDDTVDLPLGVALPNRAMRRAALR
jgi:hypothetical protein